GQEDGSNQQAFRWPPPLRSHSSKINDLPDIFPENMRAEYLRADRGGSRQELSLKVFRITAQYVLQIFSPQHRIDFSGWKTPRPFDEHRLNVRQQALRRFRPIRQIQAGHKRFSDKEKLPHGMVRVLHR